MGGHEQQPFLKVTEDRAIEENGNLSYLRVYAKIFKANKEGAPAAAE